MTAWQYIDSCSKKGAGTFNREKVIRLMEGYLEEYKKRAANVDTRKKTNHYEVEKPEIMNSLFLKYSKEENLPSDKDPLDSLIFPCYLGAEHRIVRDSLRQKYTVEVLTKEKLSRWWFLKSDRKWSWQPIKIKGKPVLFETYSTAAHFICMLKGIE